MHCSKRETLIVTFIEQLKLTSNVTGNKKSNQIKSADSKSIKIIKRSKQCKKTPYMSKSRIVKKNTNLRQLKIKSNTRKGDARKVLWPSISQWECDFPDATKQFQNTSITTMRNLCDD